MFGLTQASQSQSRFKTHHLKVTVNLFNALRYIRKSDTSITIWIDAIYINRLDIEEKVSQIKIMATIYQNATNLLH